MKNLNLKTLLVIFVRFRRWLGRYRAILFIVGIMSTYSILVLRINMLNNKQPNSNDVTNQLQLAHPPKLNPAIISKIQQLQDNSVEVKALFNQARDNPFQE
jgi:hypothetical protein